VDKQWTVTLFKIYFQSLNYVAFNCMMQNWNGQIIIQKSFKFAAQETFLIIINVENICAA